MDTGWVDPKKQLAMVATAIRTALVQDTAEVAVATWRETADRLRDRFPALVPLMDAAEQDVPGFMRSPKEHWKQISSTNPIERVSKEIKRRAKVLKPESAERLLTKQAVA